MMRIPHPFLLLISALLLAGSPAFATSYVMVADEDLADQAAAVVDAVVVSVETAPVSGRPATDYTVEIERLLAGSAPGTTLIVRVPGGVRPDGVGFHVYGAPRFAPGERAILFLAGRNDGTFGILHLGLGAFHRVAAGASPPLAVRDLSDAEEMVLPGSEPDPLRHRARDYDAFSAWLEDRGAGIERPRDYLVAADPGGTARLQGKFTFFEVGGLNLRWFEFDSGGSVNWFAHAGGQPDLPGGGFAELQQSLAAWNSDPQTPVQLRYRGQTSARNGLDDFDGINTLLQNDPNQEITGTFRCGSGGTLAIGGPWFVASDTRSFRGQEYVRIQGADIVMNDGIECLAAGSPCFDARIAAIYGHELGHTLGIGHSCGDSGSPSCAGNPELNEALMRATAHFDCRGARLAADDLRALRRLYEGPGRPTPKGPPPPADLAGNLEGASVRLRWSDRSTDEAGFRIYRSADGGPLALIGAAGAGVTRFFDDDVSPATTYAYRAAAFNDRGESAKSAPVTVTVPPAAQVTASLEIAAEQARVGEPVVFRAQFSGPAERARWSFGGGEVGFSDTRCGPSAFCRSHVFDTPGPRTVEVTLTGDFGQVFRDSLLVEVADAPFETETAASFLQWTIFGQRGDTGTFESDAWLHNAGSRPARVELSYLPRGGEVPPAPRTLTLSPAESLFLPNVLEKVFGVSAGQGSVALGVEQARVDGEPGPRVLAVSRSFVERENRAEGSFGLFVPEQGEAEWTPDPKVVTGILEGSGFISTLLGANLDDRPGRVEIDLFDRHGDPVGDPAALVLGPGVMRFQQTQALFPGVAEREGPFTAHFSSNGILFLASSTLLETGSEDQIFLPAREPEAIEELVVPRVVRSPGQFGVFLTTSLAVLNQFQAPVTVTFQLLLRGQNNSAPLEATRTVPAGGLLFLEDAIDELFGLETATGALQVSWDGGADRAPRVLAMTSSETARGGRFGMAVESLSASDAVTGEGVVFGTEQSELFRSQYGAVNLEDGRTDVRLTLRDGNGATMAQTDLVLRARQHLELNLATLFGPVAETGSNWSVTTAVVKGGPLLTYIANINASGDVFFVPGRPRAAAPDDPAE